MKFAALLAKRALYSAAVLIVGAAIAQVLLVLAGR